MYGEMDNMTILHHSIGNACSNLLSPLGLLTPFLLCIQGKQLIKRLQDSKSKAKLPFFWATSTIIHISSINFYVSVKFLTVLCLYRRYALTFKKTVQLAVFT